METSGVPIFDSDGQLSGYRGIDRDITHRKNIEETLKKAKMNSTVYSVLHRQVLGLLVTELLHRLMIGSAR